MTSVKNICTIVSRYRSRRTRDGKKVCHPFHDLDAHLWLFSQIVRRRGNLSNALQPSYHKMPYQCNSKSRGEISFPRETEIDIYRAVGKQREKKNKIKCHYCFYCDIDSFSLSFSLIIHCNKILYGHSTEDYPPCSLFRHIKDIISRGSFFFFPITDFFMIKNNQRVFKSQFTKLNG